MIRTELRGGDVAMVVTAAQVRKARRLRRSWADGLTAVHLHSIFLVAREPGWLPRVRMAAPNSKGLALLAVAEAHPGVLYGSDESACAAISAYLKRAPAGRLRYMRG